MILLCRKYSIVTLQSPPANRLICVAAKFATTQVCVLAELDCKVMLFNLVYNDVIFMDVLSNNLSFCTWNNREIASASVAATAFSLQLPFACRHLWHSVLGCILPTPKLVYACASMPVLLCPAQIALHIYLYFLRLALLPCSQQEEQYLTLLDNKGLLSPPVKRGC